MRQAWRFRLPFVRLGLLLVVGAMVVSALHYYVAFGERMGDFNGKEPALDRKGIVDQFMSDFLFSGTIAGAMFWAGLAVCVLGIAWNVVVAVRQREP
jgi:hypothetical protein